MFGKHRTHRTLTRRAAFCKQSGARRGSEPISSSGFQVEIERLNSFGDVDLTIVPFGIRGDFIGVINDSGLIAALGFLIGLAFQLFIADGKLTFFTPTI